MKDKEEKPTRGGDGRGGSSDGDSQQRVSLIHSQVRKIKQEEEKIEDQIQTRSALRDLNRQLSRSRSRLGSGGQAGRSIMVGSQ